LIRSFNVLLLVLVTFVLTLDNAADGTSFYLVPNMAKLNTCAMNNAFSNEQSTINALMEFDNVR